MDAKSNPHVEFLRELADKAEQYPDWFIRNIHGKLREAAAEIERLEELYGDTVGGP